VYLSPEEKISGEVKYFMEEIEAGTLDPLVLHTLPMTETEHDNTRKHGMVVA